MNIAPAESVPHKRRFLPDVLAFDSWPAIEPFFAELVSREIKSAEELHRWLADLNELDIALDEERAWRYIRSTCDTTNKDYEAAYEFFVTEIDPNVSPWFDKLNRKLNDSPFRDGLDPEVYAVYLRSVRNEISIYREKNIPLFTEIDQLSQQYGRIMGDMTVEMEGKELTIQQAFNFYRHPDRSLREEAFRKIWKVRLAAKEKLDSLFNKLCGLRQQVAKNAGFRNFRDYSFASLGRFDYTAEDCFRFHDAVASEVVPFLNTLLEERGRKLRLDMLRPWDLEVDTSGKPALKPFADGKELVEKSIGCLDKVRPYYASCLAEMRRLGHFDLDSRKGKAPGGYNYSLAETGVPFIFMNSAGSQRDLVTMVHEAGHAVHSFLEHPLPLHVLKSPPSEVCELASMSMELISMEHWDVFYSDPQELARARREQLEKVLDTLPWVATVDAFQHWVYENENHSDEERSEAWDRIMKRFGGQLVDWTGFEDVRRNNWQKQLHIFEVPFYYIEYGMAQLGAIAVWRNYRKNPQQALDQYDAALRLGYTKPIGKLYEAAGVRFDFSREYVKELVDFVREELARLDD